jgi:hypothetical protein
MYGACLLWSRLCENSARYNRTRNFEACGNAQSKKTQKFVRRSTLRPNQFSFSHSLGQNEPPNHDRRSAPPPPGARSRWMMSAATGMLTVIKATLRTLSRPLRPLSEVQVGVD